MKPDKGLASAQLEKIAPNEAEQIASVVSSTEKQLRNRYATKPPFRRGVHPKAHGCVEATFTVREDLDPEYRVGLFAKPGHRFRADIRFSNAAPLVTPDSPLEKDPKSGNPVRGHGSRGMAVKVHNVGGPRLTPGDDGNTQDFLMINQRVFAFANLEDYAVLSEIIAKDEKGAASFFGRIRWLAPGKPDLSDPVSKRAFESLMIVQQIKRTSFPADFKFPPAFQAPPLSPLDNSYFSAAPFLFGEGFVAKFSAKPVSPVTGDLGDAINNDDYLRAALSERLAIAGGQDIEFEFQVQKRPVEDIKDVDKDIENACTLWKEEDHAFVTVARIAIPPQDINAPERMAACEALVFSPWHGLAAHRPLGSINRLRRAVYEKSAELRGCPVGGKDRADR
jgi:hypothetical protein